MLDSLRLFHQRFAAAFELRKAEIAPELRLFFCDHGLEATELDELNRVLRSTLRCYPVERILSFDTHLCLIVSATEVGYRYQGNGTDFWPELAKSLGCEFQVAGRSLLSSWFAKAAERYQGVVPGRSAWNESFCHIAWPITHAVASRDIRRPFADSLRRFRGSTADDDRSIVSRLQSASPMSGSRRYRSWLANEALVAGIVRDLFNDNSYGKSGLLSSNFRNRLIDDLRNEPEILLAVRVAERNRKIDLRRNGSTRSAPSGKKDGDSIVQWGDYFLRRSEGRTGNVSFELVGRLPETPKLIRQAVTRLYRSRKWRPRPWGLDRCDILHRGTLTAQQGTFLVDFSVVRGIADEDPFFVDVGTLDLDAAGKDWLAAVRFPKALRIAFNPLLDDGDDSDAIRNRTPHRGTIWVAHADTDKIPVDTAVLVGTLNGGSVHAVDANDPVVRSWLDWPAARSSVDHDSEPVKFLAPSPWLFNAKGIPIYAVGDIIAIDSVGVDVTTIALYAPDESCCEIGGSGVVVVDACEPGEYVIKCRSLTRPTQLFEFELVDDVEAETSLPWDVVLQGSDRSELSLTTRRDLMNGRLVLDITGPRAIENLPLCFKITPGPCEFTMFADKLPLRVAAQHQVWSELKRQLPSSTLSSSCDLELSVSIAGVSTQKWLLEAEVETIWWERTPDTVRAVSDRGEFQVESMRLDDGIVADTADLDKPIISVAIDEEGNSLDFDGSVDAFGTTAWPSKLPKPDRLLRELDNSSDGTGLRSLVRRYLQLASASSGNQTAELHRVGLTMQLRDWIIEVCCGERWNYRLHDAAHQEVEAANPIQFWWTRQQSFPVVHPKRTEEDTALPESLSLSVLQRFASRMPYCWWDGFVIPLTDDDASRFDPLYIEILQDDNIFCDTESLNKSLQDASELLRGSHLAELIIPATGGDELLQWTIVDVTLAELSEQLESWTNEHLRPGRGRQKWSVHELSDYLNLLLYPEQLRSRPWEALLKKLLRDRPVARAGAFLAWRIEQLQRLDACDSIR